MPGKRLLLVVDEAVSAPAEGLPDDIGERLSGFDEIHVVAPALTSRLRLWTSDVDAARAAAEERLEGVLARLRGAGLHADGAIGDDDPVVAVDDALRTTEADLVLLAIHAPDCEHYREHGLVERVRSRVDLPVETVMLDAEGRFVDVVRA
jgi:hypothetical protein